MFTSITLFSSANAGELTVTGSAEATYNIVSGYATQSKGVGVTNEFDLGANGELDNGYTWNYKIAMDPDNTAGGTTGDYMAIDSITLTAVPEPSSYALIAGMLALASIMVRRRK